MINVQEFTPLFQVTLAGAKEDFWLELWCDLPNSEGFTCMEGTCWHSIDMNTCCGLDGCGLPKVEVFSEIDDCTDCGEGGGGGPLPLSPDDPWLPPPNGDGGGGCTTCEPGGDPNDNDGVEGCPLGTIADGNGGFIGEEDPEAAPNLFSYSLLSIPDKNFSHASR